MRLQVFLLKLGLFTVKYFRFCNAPATIRVYMQQIVCCSEMRFLTCRQQIMKNKCLER